MAVVEVGITRTNGMRVSARGVVEDALIVDIASLLGAMLFDASAVPADTTELNLPLAPAGGEWTGPVSEAPTDGTSSN